VTTSLGRAIQYDTCVLATGSEATYPTYAPYERAGKTKGVFVYRNISDLDSIIAYSSVVASADGHAVVVGGGLLGLEAAKAVYDLESIKKVSIVNRQDYPLSRQLDGDGGDIVLKRIRALGVDVLTKTTVKDLVTAPAIEQPSDGAQEILTGLLLESANASSLPSESEVLECNMVIFAVGITPRDDIARASGLKCYEKGGIVVDDYLKTSAEDVYAIGECASWKGNTYGLIGPGSESILPPSHSSVLLFTSALPPSRGPAAFLLLIPY
jgi:nitrite reductase (NAD(P)H)